MKVKLLLLATLVIAIGVSGFCLGVYYANDTFIPQIQTVEIPITTPPQTVTVERVVEVQVVEKIESGIMLPREFANIEEAQAWLDAWFIEHSPPNEVVFHSLNDWNCNEFAQNLQQCALEDGFLLTYCPVEDGKVWGVPVSEAINHHVGLLARIGDIYYYLESTPGFKYSLKFVRIASAEGRE